MIASIRRIPESYRLLVMVVVMFVALACVQTWPDWRHAVWALFVAFVGLLVYVGVSGTVNCESIRIDGNTIEYVAFGQTRRIRLNEVSLLEMVREEAMFADFDGPYIESKWMLRCGDGASIEVMDEWPHRKLLLKAFRANLPNFDEAAARAGLKARGEGRWRCYAAPSEHPT